MKILFLMPYSPVPPTFGGALRIYYLLKSLASSHEVTVLTFGGPEKSKLLRQEFGEIVDDIYVLPEPWSRKYKRLAQAGLFFSSRSFHNVCCYSSEMQALIDKLITEQDFDAVHCEFPAMTFYKFGSDIPRIMDAHNVEYENFRRMWLKSRSPLRKWYYYKEYKKMFREEIAALRKQDIILATSKDDIRIFKKDVSDVPAYVVPNGVDTSYFTPSQQETEPYSLVFTGMMGYTPNDDGMLWFLDEIFPLVLQKIPQTKIYIVGNKPSEQLKRRQSDNVIVTGFVDDVRPWVWKSGVFVVPLRMGSGTRLKVVEAFAMKKPVVSTSIGCEGINVENGTSILIRDEPSEFADAVVELMENQVFGEYLGKNGYELVTSVYDWSVIGNKMLDVYEVLQNSGKKMSFESVNVPS